MRRAIAVSAVLLSVTLGTSTFAQDFDSAQIEATVVAPGVAMLDGFGGNIGVSFGDEGTILVDDQFGPLSEKIKAAVAALGGNPVEFVINTHWHFDHTGGNEAFGNAGALIVAHETVRTLLAEGESRPGRRPVEPLSGAALPVVTFEQGLTIHRNGDTIDVIFLGGGHTNGDAIVRWREKNVIHMGDLFINTATFPYVDLGSGGNVVHALNAIDAALAMMDARTVVLPGHGPISDKAGLVATRAKMSEAIRRVRDAKAKAMTLEAALAADLIADMGYAESDFMDHDKAVTSIWQSLDDHGE